MKKKAPFSKKQPSVCSKQEFYWRGGDILKEKEFLSKQFNELLQEKIQADQELEKVESEVNQAQSILKEREGYSAALAEFLEPDADSALEAANLKKELQQLEQEITEKEEELEKYTSKTLPNVYSSLNKERAFYLLEKQKLEKELQNMVSDNDRNRNDLALCMASTRYRKGVILEYKVDKELKKRNYLRKMVSKAKEENDRLRMPYGIPKSREVADERNVLLKGIDTKLAINISNEKLTRHPVKYRAELEFLLKQIEDLNDRMKDVGCETGFVDIDHLRENIYASQYQAEEQEMSAETNKFTDFATIDDIIKSPDRTPRNSAQGTPEKNVPSEKNSEL